MEGVHVASTTLKITLEEFTEYIEAYIRDGTVKVKVMDGYVDAEYAKLYPPTIIGTDYKKKRVVRIEFKDNEVTANVIKY